jgi:hypothetical protein
MLVMEQQMLLVQKFHWSECWLSNNASNSNFMGFQLGKEQQVLNSQISLVIQLVIKQQMLIIQISLVCKLVMEQLMLNIQRLLV